MRLKAVKIKDFRRFTNLTVQGIPEAARLIILAGPNGCGKSSLFDALHIWHKWTSNKPRNWEPDYYVKSGSPITDRFQNQVTPEFYNSILGNNKKIFYMRSAYRNDPEFQVQNLTRVGDPLSEVRVQRMIDNDAAVSGNFQRLISQSIEDAYDPEDSSVTLGEFKEQIIGEISREFSNLFPELKLDSLGNPLEDGTFRFTKGISKGFSFKNLSGGEKAVFDLILDIVVAKRDYDNTIYCIDEPEAHMNARIQANLLSALFNLIPQNCQLILATHSIGMMRRARDIETDTSGSVVFLDFGNRDFDKPQIMEPTKPSRTFWKNAYDVALDDIANLVAPKRVIICEGEPLADQEIRNYSHDAKCYDVIFETEFPETMFVSMGSDQQIIGDKRGLAEALCLLIDGLTVVRLIDRDDRTDNTITGLKMQGIQVLSRRNLESYLFDDEVLRALALSADKEDKADGLIIKKQAILAAETKHPVDDLKRVSGKIYNACKGELDLLQYGNDAKEFMRDTLAPLIKPGMAVYDELKCDIFEKDINPVDRHSQGTSNNGET